MSKSYWNIRPRYSPGSPAMLIDLEQVKQIITAERDGHDQSLKGTYGEEQKARAEKLGLSGIVVRMKKKRSRWVCLDEITGDEYSRPSDEKMRKDGYVRFKELHPTVREMLTKAEPIIAADAAKDERPYWFDAKVKANSSLYSITHTTGVRA